MSSSCEQSWICSVWSFCSSGTQTRTCNDEHKCGVSSLKPDLSKGCNVASTGYQPSRTIPPSNNNWPVKTPHVQKPSLWESFGKYIIISGISLFLLVLIVVGVLFFHSHHHLNPKLAEWVTKARVAGKSEPEIKSILEKQGEWKKNEVDKVMKK